MRVVNTHGQQVVDTWAFSAARPRRVHVDGAQPRRDRPHHPGIGDTLVTNRRRPILTLTEDTSGGIHDTLFAACDRWRYELLGCTGYHDNCTDNLAAALAELGLAPPETPAPLNLFMNIPVVDGNRVEIRPPVSTPGSYVTLRAEADCIVAFSACPQDIVPINGLALTADRGAFRGAGLTRGPRRSAKLSTAPDHLFIASNPITSTAAPTIEPQFSVLVAVFNEADNVATVTGENP